MQLEEILQPAEPSQLQENTRNCYEVQKQERGMSYDAIWLASVYQVAGKLDFVKGMDL